MTSMEEPSPIRPATRPLRTDLLERFAVLGRQSDSAIAKFARTWGPLGLCRHGLPEAHGTVELHLSHVDTGVGEHCLIDRPSIPKWTCQESLDEWREYSKRANAVLNAIAGIRENRRTQADPWQFLGPFVTRGEPLLIPARREIDGTVYAWTAEAEPIDSQAQHEGITWPWTLLVADQRALIAERLQEWLFLGDVRPMVAWSGPEPEFILAGKELVELDTSSADSSLAPIVSLFAAIAVQLVQAVHRIDPPAICSHCGKFYSPERRPPASWGGVAAIPSGVWQGRSALAAERLGA